MENETENCVICGAAAEISCSNCETTFYCSQEHQKNDWKEHRAKCRPFKIEISKEMGRYLVATRDMKPGEIILKEPPTVIGPRMDSSLTCFGCFQVLPKNYKICSECNLAPVCGEDCSKKPFHAKDECEYYKRWFKDNLTLDFIISNLQIIMPLKCLILKWESESKKTNSRAWDNFMQLESHIKERQNDVIWQFYEEKIEKVLHSIGILKNDDRAALQNICGILDINSFEVRGPINFTNTIQNEKLRGIYAQAALMSHSCIGNTHLSVDDNFDMIIRASVPIKASEPIFFNYASPFESTSERQDRLRKGKYFTCKCKRCCDPTELGTYMGSIICTRCFDGLVIPKNLPFNLTEWFCEKCNHKYQEKLVKTTIAQGWSLIENAEEGNRKALENILRKFSTNFPPSNVIMIEIKQKLVVCLREELTKSIGFNKNLLRKKISLCEEFLSVLEIIQPGLSRLKGITLYEVHKPKLILAKKDYEDKEISSKDFLLELMKCEKILKEAISMLVYEPQISPEGRLVRVAVNELKQLREEIQATQTIIEVESVEKRKIVHKNKNRK